jgi:hypothetical protein
MIYSAAQEIPNFFRTGRFFITFTEGHHWTYPQAVHTFTPHVSMIHFYIMLLWMSMFCSLCVSFWSNFLWFFHFLHVYHMYFAHIDVITPTIWREVYKLYSFWQCNFLHSHFTSSFLGQNILVHLQFRFSPHREGEGGERFTFVCNR